MGYSQIIEGKDCKHLRGQAVTFRFRTRLSASDNIRISVLEWTGSEDSVTSDVVGTWTSTTYTVNNFFANIALTIDSATQQALTAATLTDSTSVTVTLGSSFNNLIVFVWTENAVAQNVTFDIGKLQLEKGSVATEFEQRMFNEERALCQRYYLKELFSNSEGMATCTNYSTAQAIGAYRWPTTMRVAPTVTFDNATGFLVIFSGTSTAALTMAGTAPSTHGCRIDVTTAAVLTLGFSSVVEGSTGTESINASARL